MSVAPGAECVIELRDVHKAFGGNRVLRGVDLAIRDGETFTILGGSGSGKSVCLKHMIGLLKPDAGRVLMFGRDITSASEDELIAVAVVLRRRGVQRNRCLADGQYGGRRGRQDQRCAGHEGQHRSSCATSSS